MKLRKIILAVILLALLCCASGNVFCLAENTQYLKVSKENVKLYKNSNPTNNLDAYFILPNTYYLKLLTEGDYLNEDKGNLPSNTYYVEYKGIRGLVLKSDFSAPTLNVVAPYYDANIQVASNTKLYDILPLNKNSVAPTRSIAITDAITYYSFITDEDGIYYYYVKATLQGVERYGYIKATDTTDPTIATTYIKHVNSRDDNTDTDGNEKDDSSGVDVSNNLLKRITAIGVVIPTVVLMIMFFHPQKDKKKE